MAGILAINGLHPLLTGETYPNEIETSSETSDFQLLENNEKISSKYRGQPRKLMCYKEI